MARLADGDRQAFEPVFRALWPLLRRFVGGQLSPADADDVAQEALLKLFARASEFSPDGDAVSWALGVAAYEVRTAKKRHSRRREQAGEAPEAIDPFRADVILESRQLEAAALEVLGTLRPEDIETLKMVSEGRRPPVPAATFRKRVERAVKRLRLAWSAKHGAE